MTTKEIKTYMLELHNQFNEELSDKQIYALGKMFYERDAEGSFDPEMAAVQRGIELGLRLYRQIEMGYDLNP